MRLKVNKSKNSINYYIITDFKTQNGKRSTKVFKKLGNEQKILQISNGKNALDWSKEQLDQINKQIQENTLKVSTEFSPTDLIEKNNQNSYNCGYLFLEKLYYQLGLNDICEYISSNYQFKYNLNEILSRLIFGRVIFPSSKLATKELSKKFIEQPEFELHDIYRALEVIAKENDYIQSELYKNSLKVIDRNSKILYYDCTNYFF